MDTVWKRIALGICLLIVFVIAFALREVLSRLFLLLLVSATLAYLLTPLASRLPFGKGLSAGLSFFALFVLLAGILLAGIPAFLRQLTGLRDSLPAILGFAESAADRLRLFLLGIGVPESSLSSLREQLMQSAGRAAGNAASRLMAAGSRAAGSWYLLLSPVIAYYMLRDRQGLFDTVLRLIPSSLRLRAQELGLRIRRDIGDYVRGQLTVSLITGSLTALGLLLVGLPSWLVMGLVMAVFNLIPYFGPMLATIPILLFSIPSGLATALFSALVVLAAQQAESMIVAPRIIGQAAQLHPGFVILCLTVGSWLFGFAGLFFSIPAVLSIRALVTTVRDMRLRALSKSN